MISKIIMYLLAIALGVLFALFLSAPVGWTFVYMLVCAPIFSFLVTLFLHKRKSVSLTVDVNRTMLYKRETVTLKITAVNRSVFPVPAVKIKLAVPKGLVPADGGSLADCKSMVLSISPRSETTAEMVYTAKVWGSCFIGAESAALHDFMGFFHFKMSCVDLQSEIKVFPDIPEMAGDAPLLRAAAENARFADDSEETKESDGMTRFAGMPGYTHREYAEGDPVRRINWKLSSKRDKYMVRLDDEIESVRQNMVLDCVGGDDVYLNERAVEGLLAAALGLLKCGFESTVYCRFDGAYEAFEIAEPADVSELQTRLASFKFTGADEPFKGKRIPDISEDGGGKSILFYTPLFNKKLSAEISAAEEQGVLVSVVSSDSISSGNAYQVWRLNEDFSAEMI